MTPGRQCGLSPRVRGNPTPCPGNRPPSRSIPACAGEPLALPPDIRLEEVYPRVCGGTPLHRRGPRYGGGLSPRVRGNHSGGQCRFRLPRSIPACAGEPAFSGRIVGICEVYPRVCGGTGGDFGSHFVLSGLSPRVRGNPAMTRRLVAPVGSIPACAGEPHSVYIVVALHPVYPRVCGGTAFSGFGGVAPFGLSPSVRGNLHHRPVPLDNERSIPACAGEPYSPWTTPWAPTVYPRVCGGTYELLFAARGTGGLSPRVRGNPAGRHPRRHRDRSIPACAGEPGPGAGRAGWAAVYPRVCGGTGWVG